MENPWFQSEKRSKIFQPKVDKKEEKIEIKSESEEKKFNHKDHVVVLPHSKTDVSVWLENWTKEPDNYGVLPKPTEELRRRWKDEQYRLKQQIDLRSSMDWNKLKYIGGVDISFAKNNKIDACASIIICNYPSMQIIHESYQMIKLDAPYVAGFLGFREVPFIVDMLDKLKKEIPEIFPQLLMIDGNGILHMRGCGQACHLGVSTGIPCLGVAKKLLYADGITEEQVQSELQRTKNLGSLTAELFGNSGRCLATAFRAPTKKGHVVLFISPGHKIDMKSSVKLVQDCMIGNKLPEPIFQADHLSREFLRFNYPHF